jgi:nitroreductase
MQITQAIEKRRSVRKFKQEIIEDAVLEKLVDAARMAPSAANRQQLEFYIIRTPEKVAEIFKLTAWAGFVKPHRTPRQGKDSPVAFIGVTAPKDPSTHIYADAGAAIQNILLRAVEQGLGSCWIGSFDAEKAAEIVALPPERTLLYLVAAGYPDEAPVMEDIAEDQSPKYYLDDNDILHVPKYVTDAITYWC